MRKDKLMTALLGFVDKDLKAAVIKGLNEQITDRLIKQFLLKPQQEIQHIRKLKMEIFELKLQQLK